MKIPLKALVLATFLTGCASPLPPTDLGWYWESYENLEYQCWDSQKESDRLEWILVCNERASKSSENRSERLVSIFTVFRRFVRPGFKSGDCRKIMEDAKWLDEVQIRPVRAMGGWMPVEMRRGSSAFIMALPPDENVPDDWFICFTLTGLEPKGLLPWEECQQKARDFFKGKLHDSRVRLHQFALCYPHEPLSKIELFTAHGTGLMVK